MKKKEDRIGNNNQIDLDRLLQDEARDFKFYMKENQALI